MKLAINVIVFVLLLSGCTTNMTASVGTDAGLQAVPQQQLYPQINHASESQNQFHWHVEQIARQLFDTAIELNPNMKVIVGTILPSETLLPEQKSSLRAIGLQLQESLATYSTQAGLRVVEYKTMSTLGIEPTADVLLSRDNAKLRQKINAQYAITGTYTEQELAILVNIRLIRLSDNTVMAAATDSVPLNSFWSHKKIKMQGDKLFRGAY